MKVASSNSLAQTVALLAPEAGEAILPVARRQALTERYRCLPPLVDGLFEFRLAAGEMAVDLHQRVGQGSREIVLLQHYLEAEELPFMSAVATLLAKLIAAWQKPKCPLYDTMLETWLAYEFDTTGESTLLPSISVGLSQSLISPDERWIAMQVALDILMEGRWRLWQEALLRTMVACPPEAFVSHIGVMLGRSTPALRVNVKRLRPQTLARYLEIVAWSGEIATVVALAEKLFQFADHITLCLDVGTQIYPQLGLACVLNSTSATEPRWAALLDYLIRQGLCTTAKRDGFLGWAGMTTPLLTDYDWPDQLIVESLSHPANHLSVLQRRFGHIKISYRPDEPLLAKGYLRFVPQWLKL